MNRYPHLKSLLGIVLSLTVIPFAWAESNPNESESFFRVAKVDGQWQLLAPSGQPFYLRGLNHYGDGSGMPWNLKETHGSVAAWRKSLRDRVKSWGFNYLPPSIGPTSIDPSTVEKPHGRHNLVTRTPEWTPQQFAELDFPFTIFLEYPRQYMGGRNLPDVFSKEFEQAVDARCCEACAPLKNNPNLIGYHFCHNPPWHPQAKSFNNWIEDITGKGSAGRTAWIELMKQIYGTVDRWAEVYGVPIESWDDIQDLDDPLRGYVYERKHLDDRLAFMQRICERWYRVYHDAVRRHDPHHLIFGDRNTLHLQPLPEYAMRVMKPYVDVLSVNAMGPPEIVYEVLEDATRVWDGPIHLADTGAGIYSSEPPKSAYQTRNLEEFEKVYAGMMQMSVDHPQIIGFGWCGFYETPHPGGRSGLVDVATGTPIPDRLDVMRRWNTWIEKYEQKAARQ